MKRLSALIFVTATSGLLMSGTLMNIHVQAATEEPQTSVSDEDDVDSWMPDKNLQTGLSYQLNENYGLKLTKNNLGKMNNNDKYHEPGTVDINILREFNASDNVKSLEGIQYAINLKKLSFELNGYYPDEKRNGGIVDISPIKNMTQLTLLNLVGNSIENIASIKNLTNLETLRISLNSITNFDVLNKLPKITDLSIDGQTRTEPTKNISNRTFSVDLNSYLGTSGNETISDVQPEITNNTADVSYDSKTNVITVSNATADDTLVIKYTGNVTYNGSIYPVKTTITQPYTVKISKPVIKTRNISLTVGDKWNSSQGLISVTDKYGDAGTINDLDISGDKVNTEKPGTYKVIYTSKEDKSVSAEATVTVEPKHTSSEPVRSNVESISPMKITLGSEPISIYSSTGNYLDTLKLSDFTNYTISKKNTVDGITYYQLSEDKWIRANDIPQTYDHVTVIQTHSNSNKRLYKLTGDLITDRELARATDWKVDKIAFINGSKYYRVATDEWVKADDGIEITSLRGIVQPNQTAHLYTDFGKKSNRALAKNSRFVTDKRAKINGNIMYRVSTGEWVKADQVNLG
ncbi:SLAP domain-containing protein [Companilactobacillus zhachilii]|uniref:SLAP domain-containing protein n=1 Tax=Companilactobacillus zhachilii TaxID=2304606 RepID=UPI0040331A52